MNHISQGRPGAVYVLASGAAPPAEVLSLTAEDMYSEKQTCKPPAALPQSPFPAVCAPGTPQGMAGGFSSLWLLLESDLSERLSAKLEINFRSSSGFI